jgi:hypothetical protein
VRAPEWAELLALGNTRLDPGDNMHVCVVYGFGGGWVFVWRIPGVLEVWGLNRAVGLESTVSRGGNCPVLFAHAGSKSRSDTRGLGGVVVVVLCWLGVVGCCVGLGCVT